MGFEKEGLKIDLRRSGIDMFEDNNSLFEELEKMRKAFEALNKVSIELNVYKKAAEIATVEIAKLQGFHPQEEERILKSIVNMARSIVEKELKKKERP
jgi:hypothetical protein